MPPDDYYEGYETVQNKINPNGVFRYMVETRHCPLRDWDIEHIAKAFGLGVGTMRGFIKRNGLDARLEDEVMGKVNYIEVEDLYNQGKTDAEICKALHISAPTVGLWRKKNNLHPNGQKATKQLAPAYLENHVDIEKSKEEITAEVVKVKKPEQLIVNKDFDEAVNEMIATMPPRQAVATPDPLPTYVEALPDQTIAKKAFADSLQDLINIQGQQGNWDVDPYMTGLYNGLILAQSVLTGEEPQFRQTPQKTAATPIPVIEEPDSWSLVKNLEEVIVFLKGVAIGAGIKDINELLEVI